MGDTPEDERFKKDLSRYKATDLIRILGCPRGTAYDWLDGRRVPPEWQHPHWLRILRDAEVAPDKGKPGKPKK